MASNRYTPESWAHHLDEDLREQEEASGLRHKRRRQLKALDKKITQAHQQLQQEIHSNPVGSAPTEDEREELVAQRLGMSIDDYYESVAAIEDMKEGDALANSDSGTLFLRDLRANGAPLLTREQEVDLARRARDGDERARDQLVSANLRLCARLARFFRSRGLERLLDYTDLVNAGVIGLQAAIKKFDPDRGVPLASFAYSYITGAIRDELEKAAMIRLPRHVALLASKIIRAMDDLHSRLERKPTYEEIAAQLELTPEKVFEILQTIYELSKPIHPSPQPGRPNVTEAGGPGVKRWDPESQDAWDYYRRRSNNYRAEEEDEQFGGGRTDADDLVTEDLLTLLREALDSHVLTKEEYVVLSKRFGLDEDDLDLEDLEALERGEPVREGKSLTRIARHMGVSKQLVSKVYRRALAKLRKAIQASA